MILTAGKRKAPQNGAFLSIGVPGFEPGTSCPPDKRANQAAPHPVSTSTLSPPGVSGRPSASGGLLGGIASDAAAGCATRLSRHFVSPGLEAVQLNWAAS